MELVQIILTENRRIKELVKDMTNEEQKMYLEGYKDCMIYNEELSKYQREQRHKNRLQ